ncbi:hypothetical protein [Tabrizicola sp.]|uniref:hypothetical protein n=1 Tax=Tabrizicola sp. TaxID=2005166 RepID=UPI003F396826
MSYSSSTPQTGAPLGVGAVVSESFSILMRHFLPVVLLAFVPTLIGNLISVALIRQGVLGVTADPGNASVSAILVPTLLMIVVQLVVYGLATALLVQLAYDAKLERPLRLASYFGPAIAAIVPIAILGIAGGLVMAVGLMALVVPGLWIYAVFSMMSPAVVIEKVGFSGLGRSAELTKEYRWPVLGALILVGIIGAVINYVAQWIGGMLVISMGAGFGAVVVSIVLISALAAIGLGLGSIAVALIYARLREIKEGASVRDIAAVFD